MLITLKQERLHGNTSEFYYNDVVGIEITQGRTLTLRTSGGPKDASLLDQSTMRVEILPRVRQLLVPCGPCFVSVKLQARIENTGNYAMLSVRS